MLFAPFFGDMFHDLSTRQAFNRSIGIMNDTLGLARRLGVTTVGLGATLPKLLMMFDDLNKPVDDEAIVLTTGHATTIWLMGEMTTRLSRVGKNPEHRVGVIGAGSIGTAYLTDLRKRLGYDREAFVFDTAGSRCQNASELDQRNKIATSIGELIGNSDIIICAATTPIRLDSSHDLSDTLIVDDSQPGCFDSYDVVAHGGQLVWVIAQDPTFGGNSGEITCKSFDYGGSGPTKKSEVWGCQAEAWAVHKDKSLAVRGEVTSDDVRRMGNFMSQLGLKTAPLQAQGRYLQAA